MPNPTPGAQRISLVDRVAAVFGYTRRTPDLGTVAFGPGTPIEPTPIAVDQAPRQFEYNSGVNLSLRPRGEYPKLALTPFEQLRQLARFYDVASICIETRINWMCSANWSITARDKRRQAESQPICNQIERFFRRPDRVTPFPIWLRTVLLDQLEIDALTVFKQRDRLGRLLSLDYIDGSTIKPLLNERGKTAAYQQILYGYVRGEYAQPGMPAPDPWPAGGDLLYLPRWTSTDSPYGRSPTEQIILRVNMAIRKQTRDLAHWTDGNVPPGFMSPPDGVSMNPEQARQFEDAFNADLAGLDRAMNQIKFMPWNGKYTETKPFSYSREIDDFLLEVACASYHIPKNELGMTDKVNKASSQEQEDVAFRHAVAPDAKWLKEVLFDPIIHDDLGRPDLQFDWDFGKAEDQAAHAQTEQADIAAGVITADESRRRRYPDLDGKAPGPPAGAAPAGAAPVPVQTLTAPLGKLAKAANHTGAMVALMLPANVARQLVSAVDSLIDSDPEDAADLHITLAYLGKTSDPDVAGNYFHCKQVLDEVSRRMPPITGVLNGIGRFHQDEGDGRQALWAAFDAPELPQWRQELVEALGAFSVPVADNHGFTPHVTLAYIPKDVSTPHIELPTGELTFDKLTLCWGDDRQEWPLLGKAIQKAETVTTGTGLVADDRAPKKKRRRGKRKPINVAALIESEAAGALEWAKLASKGE